MKKGFLEHALLEDHTKDVKKGSTTDSEFLPARSFQMHVNWAKKGKFSLTRVKCCILWLVFQWSACHFKCMWIGKTNHSPELNVLLTVWRLYAFSSSEWKCSQFHNSTEKLIILHSVNPGLYSQPQISQQLKSVPTIVISSIKLHSSTWPAHIQQQWWHKKGTREHWYWVVGYRW